VAGTGQPVYVSPQLQTLMGVPADEWVDGPDGWTKRMHPDDRHLGEQYAETVRTGEPYSAHYRLVDLEGRVRWFRDEAGALRAAAGGARFIQGVIFEVTEQKEGEAALLESERRFREMLENVHLAAVTTDVEGRVLF